MAKTVNINDLTTIRKTLKDTCPLTYQAEIYINVYEWNKYGLNANYDKDDLTYYAIDTAIKIWNGATANIDNIFKTFADTNGYKLQWKAWVEGFPKALKYFKDNKKWESVEDAYKTTNRGTTELFNEFTEQITQLGADKKALSDAKATAEKELKNIYPTYPIIKDEEKPENVKKQIKDLGDRATTAETSLKSWTDTFKDKKPDEIKANIDLLSQRPDTTQENYKKLVDNQEKHTDYDQIKTNLDNWTKTFPNLDFNQVKTEYDKPKEAHEPKDLKPADLPDNWKEQLATIPTLTTNQKPSDYDAKIKELGEWQANFPNQKPSEAKNQAEQQGNQSATGNIALNKLLAIYKEEITKRTELFYQDLAIDNNEVNAKYGDKQVSYLELLKNLTADSEPEQVINAFRIVALIIATDKAQTTTNKYKDRLTSGKIPANLKKNNLKTFKNIKDTWDLITDEPQATNNPLYLDIITQKNSYMAQINNIILLWQ